VTVAALGCVIKFAPANADTWGLIKSRRAVRSAAPMCLVVCMTVDCFSAP
jgi:hypothetical protein